MAKGMKTGGRKKGTPNKKTVEVRAMLDEVGCNPILLLAETALGRPMKARMPGTPEMSEPVDLHPTVDQILSARSKLAEFYAPKLKAIEHSGSVGTHEDGLDALEELDELDEVMDDSA